VQIADTFVAPLRANLSENSYSLQWKALQLRKPSSWEFEHVGI
jgi:hypothetical protein